MGQKRTSRHAWEKPDLLSSDCDQCGNPTTIAVRPSLGYIKAMFYPEAKTIEMVWSHPAHGCRCVCANGTDLGSRGNNEKGKASTTWRRTISEELKKAGIAWVEAERLAKNRVAWRDLVEASSAS